MRNKGAMAYWATAALNAERPRIAVHIQFNRAKKKEVTIMDK